MTARLLVSAVTVATVCIAAAGTASAQDAKCHATIAKNIGKYQATLMKAVSGCHKARNGLKTAESRNCNDVVTDGADLKGTLNDTRDKVRAAIDKGCGAASGTNFANIQALYPRCPVPVKDADDGETTTGIDTVAELSNCLIALSDEYVTRLSTSILGNPDVSDGALAKELASCQGAIAKTASKAIATAGKERAKCQAAKEKLTGTALDFGADCAIGDPSGKIEPTLSAVNFAIDASCGPLTGDQLRSLGVCGQSEDQLIECVVDRVVRPLANGLAAAAQELPGTCPASANVLINSGYGVKQTDTVLDSGYTGLAHGVDVIDRYLGAVNLSNCDDDCDNCDVTLDPTPVPDNYTGTYSTCRCSNDVTINCDVINGADTECGGNTCQCFFGPPLPLSSASTPVCVSNRFAAEFDGTTIGLGEYSVTTATKAVVHTGINVSQPCPTCDGETEAQYNNGVRQGTCNGGTRNGSACDVNATSLDFGNTSFDCPPDPGTNISGTGLTLALEFSSGTQSITAALAGGGCSVPPCHCMQCSGDTTIGCSSNAECAAAGAGTCTSGTQSKQNDCVDGIAGCVDVGNNQGQCDSDTPTVSHCDGLVRADDRNGAVGIITCSDDSDCDALDPDCPGNDCGSCVPDQIRSCFLPTITTTGDPGIFESNGISTFCTAQTSNPGVNSAGGLPGPGRVKLNFNFDLYCANGTQYNLPGGSNCP
ncbi:MAG TPA: hypothetical protein VEC57_06790 [Candidatus Limnocylindrales bacterium]|nr:hypothetical protein [Candidatus Limnocylindrales bacterium]